MGSVHRHVRKRIAPDPHPPPSFRPPLWRERVGPRRRNANRGSRRAPFHFRTHPIRCARRPVRPSVCQRSAAASSCQRLPVRLSRRSPPTVQRATARRGRRPARPCSGRAAVNSQRNAIGQPSEVRGPQRESLRFLPGRTSVHSRPRRLTPLRCGNAWRENGLTTRIKSRSNIAGNQPKRRLLVKTALIQIGNSRGIRIPKAFLGQCQLLTVSGS